ncbi:hypothetical protein STPYR_12862 [uncultured Stenotrophomonas sp.]|uniref:Uncharacterized protein n=1 Tax=uncultured Stenotrophomonas sp. TaxID=165438 RepID=A0A1Y5Q6I8_9GAMM|nr:hypothetical protein STPYR_12862 [uncultured Stenotrophomonas sp.]
MHAQHEGRISNSIPHSYLVTRRKIRNPPAARISPHDGISCACPIAKPRENARNEGA